MNDGEKFLLDAIASVRRAVADQNWLAALTLALTLPDICGKVTEPESRSSSRYAAWFDQWLGQEFHLPAVTPHGDIRLSGRDCYALRCAALHEGRDVIEDQRIRGVLRGFMFVRPSVHMFAHMNQIGRTLQLQVDFFCEQVCAAVERWLHANQRNTRIREGLGEHIMFWGGDEPS